MSRKREIWGPVDMREDQTKHWHIGHRRIWLRKEAARWLFATDLKGATGVEVFASGARKSVDLPWQTVVGIEGRDPLLLPALPDQPVLLKSPNPVQVLPGAALSLLVAIPVWVTLEAGVVLFDMDTNPISRTWFGDTQAGETAYALEIADWMFGEVGEMGAGHIHVPLKIRNESQNLLSFQRLLVRVVHLSLFGKGEQLFTNDVVVTFRSVTQYSHIGFASASSLDPGGSRLLKEPRQRVSDNLIRRSFLFFRGLAE